VASVTPVIPASDQPWKTALFSATATLRAAWSSASKSTSAAPLSMIEGTTQATIGGLPAEVTFAGLSPGYAGLAQVNIRIPQGLSQGDHPAFIVINGIPSNAGLISLR